MDAIGEQQLKQTQSGSSSCKRGHQVATRMSIAINYSSHLLLKIGWHHFRCTDHRLNIGIGTDIRVSVYKLSLSRTVTDVVSIFLGWVGTMRVVCWHHGMHVCTCIIMGGGIKPDIILKWECRAHYNSRPSAIFGAKRWYGRPLTVLRWHIGKISSGKPHSEHSACLLYVFIVLIMYSHYNIIHEAAIPKPIIMFVR